MLGKCSKSGFTLIEVLVAFALIALLAGIVIPNFKNMLPRREREVFIGKVNAITRLAWQRALIERKVHKVVFAIKNKQFWVEAPTGTTKLGEIEFAPIKGSYFNTSAKIPANIEIKNFIIEGFDEMSAYGREGAKESWFFIMPDGLTQTVTINFLDTKQLNAAGKPRQFGLVLNPFNAQFKVYDGFQK